MHPHAPSAEQNDVTRSVLEAGSARESISPQSLAMNSNAAQPSTSNPAILICKLASCTAAATFRYDGDDEPIYCHNHMPLSPTKKDCQKCYIEDCSRVVTHGSRDSRTAWSCGVHQKSDMIQLRGTSCDILGCRARSTFFEEGSYRGYVCKKHKALSMINTDRSQVCRIPHCRRRSQWMDIASGAKCVCDAHTEPAVAYTHLREVCPDDECSDQPTHGAPDAGKPSLCPARRLAGSMETQEGKCSAPGCSKVPSYGVDGRREVCREHKERGMINATLTCEHRNCNKNPSFAPRGQTRRRFCKRHAGPGMVNVYYKYCGVDQCPERASFESGEKLRCLTHSDPSMKPRNNICQVVGGGCTRQSSYGMEGGKPVVCTTHKQPGMVQLRTKKCKYPRCEKIPSYGYPCRSREYCKPHALEGMVYSAGSCCRFRGCREPGAYNFPGVRGGSFCLRHREDGMVDIQRKRCEEPGCNYAAIYGDVADKKKKFCSRHKLQGMMSFKQAWPGIDRGSQAGSTNPLTDNNVSRGAPERRHIETLTPPAMDGAIASPHGTPTASKLALDGDPLQRNERPLGQASSPQEICHARASSLLQDLLDVTIEGSTFGANASSTGDVLVAGNRSSSAAMAPSPLQSAPSGGTDASSLPGTDAPADAQRAASGKTQCTRPQKKPRENPTPQLSCPSTSTIPGCTTVSSTAEAGAGARGNAIPSFARLFAAQGSNGTLPGLGNNFGMGPPYVTALGMAQFPWVGSDFPSALLANPTVNSLAMAAAAGAVVEQHAPTAASPPLSHAHDATPPPTSAGLDLGSLVAAAAVASPELVGTAAPNKNGPDTPIHPPGLQCSASPSERYRVSEHGSTDPGGIKTCSLANPRRGRDGAGDEQTSMADDVRIDGRVEAAVDQAGKSISSPSEEEAFLTSLVYSMDPADPKTSHIRTAVMARLKCIMQSPA